MVLYEAAPNRRAIATQALYFASWLAVTVFAVYLRPSPTGHGTHEELGFPPCPSVLLFSRPCPGCGLTTSWTALVHGRFAEAFHAHPLGPALYALFTVTAFMALRAWLSGRRMVVDTPGFNKIMTCVAVAFFAFGLVRMAVTPNYRTPQDIAALR